MSQRTDTIETPNPRDLGQAVMELRYAIEYGELHEKFWSHVDTFLSFLQIAAGALAFAGVFKPESAVTPIAGVVLALLSAFQLTVKPRERSIQFRDSRRTLQGLNGRAWEMTLEALDAEFERVKSEAPRGIEAFTHPAENRVLARYGYASMMLPLTKTERLVQRLAS